MAPSLSGHEHQHRPRPAGLARGRARLAASPFRSGTASALYPALKAHRKYEFRAKVSVAVTNREGLVVGMQTYPGSPYDGQTLAPALTQVERLTGTTPARCYVGRGYRGTA